MTPEQRIGQLEAKIDLALDALSFDAGDWTDDSRVRHLLEQIELAKQHLIKQPSELLTDGLPTLYISSEGYVCTHRMDEADIPVWSKPSQAHELLKLLTEKESIPKMQPDPSDDS